MADAEEIWAAFDETLKRFEEGDEGSTADLAVMAKAIAALRHEVHDVRALARR